jgi:hypothetical protein
MVTIQQHHNGTGCFGHQTRNLINDLRPYRATDEVGDTRVRVVVHLLDIDGDDSSVADEVEDGGKKVGRSSAIRATFDQEVRAKLAKRLLDCPQIQNVLPYRFAEPC